MFYSLFEIIRLAVRCLGANLLRSLLTLLGIIIGVASVIFMMSVTAGASREILKEMQKLGLRNIILNSVDVPLERTTTGRPDRIKQYGLLQKDVEQIRSTCSDVEFVTQAHEVREEAWLGSKFTKARVLAVEPKYFEVLALRASTGRRFTDLDNERRALVCNCGTQMLDKLGVVTDRLELCFQIRDLLFNVVGVLDEPQFTSRHRAVLAASSKLSTLYIPAKTALRHFGTTFFVRRPGVQSGVSVEVDQAIIGVKPGTSVLATAEAIRKILERNHQAQDYQIVVPLKLLQQEKKTQSVFSITMVLIAGISLLVGGIGIINIMLATVTERTREIGIRRACGAKQYHIMYQFLIETTTLSLLGGVIGALVGVGGVHFVAPKIGWAAVVTPESLALAMGISCAVGILFGTYPAIKAARMDPIEALRFE